MVTEVARNASMDFSVSDQISQNGPGPVLPVQPGPNLAPTFADRRCKIQPRERAVTKRTSRFRLNKFHNRPAKPTGQIFDEMMNSQQSNLNNGHNNETGPNSNSTESGPVSNQTGDSPGTDTDSPLVPFKPAGPNNQSDQPTGQSRPLSPKYIKKAVPLWSGLKLPIDQTGSGLKSDRCRPKLELDGLEPEVIYRSVNTKPVLLPEFHPRKRLKKKHVSEVPEVIGVRRIPDGLISPTGEKSEVKTDNFPGIKSEVHPGMAWDEEDKNIKPINLLVNPKSEQTNSPYNIDSKSIKHGIDEVPYDNILTPSPDGGFSPKPYPRQYTATSRSVIGYPCTPGMDSGFDSAPTLTPPTPNPQFLAEERANEQEELEYAKLRKENIYENAAKEAECGIYAPVDIPDGRQLNLLIKRVEKVLIYIMTLTLTIINTLLQR